MRRQRRSSLERESEFAFAHALVRDVAYAQIARADRAASTGPPPCGSRRSVAPMTTPKCSRTTGGLRSSCRAAEPTTTRPRARPPRAAQLRASAHSPSTPSRPPPAIRGCAGAHDCVDDVAPACCSAGAGASSGCRRRARAALAEGEKRSSRPVSWSRPSRPTHFLPRRSGSGEADEKSPAALARAEALRRRLGGCKGAGDRVLGPVHLARRRRRRRAARPRRRSPCRRLGLVSCRRMRSPPSAAATSGRRRGRPARSRGGARDRARCSSPIASTIVNNLGVLASSGRRRRTCGRGALRGARCAERVGDRAGNAGLAATS